MLALKQKFERLSKKQLRRRMWLFFLALFIPSTLLIYKAISQLKWETFHQHRQLAEEFSNRFDTNLSRLIEVEEKRSFTDYSFLNVAGDSFSNVLLRSPLSSYPVKSQIPGLLGYFQIDTEGNFSTTLLPKDSSAAIYGVSTDELEQRTILQEKLFYILSENKLVEKQTNKPSSSTIVGKLDQKQLEVARESRRDQQKEQELSGNGIAEVEDNKPSVLSGIGSNIISGTVAPLEQDSLSTAADSQEPELGAFYSEKSAAQSPQEMVEESPYFSRTLPSSPQSQLAFDDLKKSKTPMQKRSKMALDNEADFETDKDAAIVLADESLMQDLTKEKKAKKIPPKKNSRKNEAIEERVTVVGSRLRTEKNLLPEQTVVGNKALQSSTQTDYRVQIFQSEIDLFELSLLDSGHFVLFRKVWRNGNRYIQGALIEPETLLDELVERDFNETSLAEVSHLSIAYNELQLLLYPSRQLNRSGFSKSYLSEDELQGELLYQTRLSAPFSELEFIFTVDDLAAATGDSLVLWISLLIVLVLCLGFYLMYQLGCRQIDLLSQQQDFVSSVSHELKTPLTSIRMYGEMLLQGWVNDEKKQEYYRYIHDESERLSRLINNVLQLSKMSRDDLQIHLQLHTVSELTDHIRSKISSQLESAGYKLNLACDSELMEKRLELDLDAFTQVIINLVDNAIKFSATQEPHQIEIGCRLRGSNRIEFSVRDFGKGIAKEQMKKIFKLFYRVENELTRETIGTGIGLALVQKLVIAMNGEVDVVNCRPGAEFRISFPLAKNNNKNTL